MPRELEGAGPGHKVNLLEEYKSERGKLLERMTTMTDVITGAGGFVISAQLAPTQEIREEGFINQSDSCYLKQYAIEHLIDLLARERLNRFDDLLTKQTDIGRLGRASIVDRLFQVAQNIKIDDKSVVFQAVSLLDRYYDQKSLTVKPSSDCLLTGYTTLFIASKNSEVEPLSLSDIKNHFLQKNYERSQILQKELDIRQATNYENEVSTLFDFVMLYMKIWKMGCQYKISEK